MSKKIRRFQNLQIGGWLNRLLACSLALLMIFSLTPGGALLAQDQPKISVQVKVVNVLATVRDKKGQIVSNLGKDDFTLEEDGRPQLIQYFSHESDLPLTLGLLVDTSESQRSVLGEERDASETFLDRLLREDKDNGFIIHFDREVELLQDLTNSHPKLEAALKMLDAPTLQRSSGSSGSSGDDGYPQGGGRGGGRNGGGAGTLLYDGVYLASNELMAKQHGRKALVVLSDGVDRGSKESLESAIESAKRADTIVYSVLFVGEQPRGGGGGFGGPRLGGLGGLGGGGRRGGGGGQRYPQEERPDGKKILDRISKETGGHLFEVSKKLPIDQIYAQIDEELRNQYSLGYTPDNSNGSYGYRKINLIVKQKDMVVQARDGYYAQP
jgi:VWFA-related protein